MKAAAIIICGAVLLAVGVAVTLGLDSTADQGREVYAMQKCALCHSVSGIGGKKMALDGVGSRLKPEEIRKWIQSPRSMKADTTMKAYPNLPEKALRDLVDYLSTLK